MLLISAGRSVWIPAPYRMRREGAEEHLRKLISTPGAVIPACLIVTEFMIRSSDLLSSLCVSSPSAYGRPGLDGLVIGPMLLVHYMPLTPWFLGITHFSSLSINYAYKATRV